MRRPLLLVVLALLAMLAGCGGSRSPLHAPPQSARVPEGATSGAARLHTQYANGPLPLALTGSAIRIDSAGIAFVAQFENVYHATYCPYWDPYGHVWSRGFGETDWSGDFGGVCISHAKALANLGAFMESSYQYAVRGLGVNLNHHQVDALDSFVWNLGPGSMLWQPLRSQLQRHDPYGLLAYDRAGGVVLSGLASRRRAEVALFLKPEPKPAPTRAQLEDQVRHDRSMVRVLRALEQAHHCRQPPYRAALPARYEHACHVWVPQGRALDRQISTLEAKLR